MQRIQTGQELKGLLAEPCLFAGRARSTSVLVHVQSAG